MHTHVYANLAPMGWVELTEDSIIGNREESPVSWALDGGHLDSIELDKLPNNMDNFPFVNVCYEGKNYRVSPFDIQIVKSDN